MARDGKKKNTASPLPPKAKKGMQDFYKVEVPHLLVNPVELHFVGVAPCTQWDAGVGGAVGPEPGGEEEDGEGG